jgi:exodeoxyribonuclease-1
MDAIWAEVFYRPAGEPLDVDEDLYNGFVSKDDRRLLDGLRAKPGPAGGGLAIVQRCAPGRAAVPLPRAQLPRDAVGDGMEHWEQHRAARFTMAQAACAA